MDRRTFLKIAGMGSVAITAGCTSEADKTLFSLVHAPDDMVTGKAAWYATTCRECPAGCGIIAKNREGRVIKIEGNPLHPINCGKLCMRGQSALQRIYHPDRIKTPLLKAKETWQPISFSKALALLKDKAAGAATKGSNRVRMPIERWTRNTPFLESASETMLPVRAAQAVWAFCKSLNFPCGVPVYRSRRSFFR